MYDQTFAKYDQSNHLRVVYVLGDHVRQYFRLITSSTSGLCPWDIVPSTTEMHTNNLI
jgi:hypothetical protein